MKRLDARFELGAGAIEISGRGLGTAPGTVGWSGIVSARDIDLEQICSVWSGCHDDFQKTSIAADMSWYYNKGEWQLAGDVAAQNVVYRTGSGNKHSLEGRTNFFIEGIKGKNWKLWLNDFFLAVDHQQPVTGNWFLAGDKTLNTISA